MSLGLSAETSLEVRRRSVSLEVAVTPKTLTAYSGATLAVDTLKERLTVTEIISTLMETFLYQGQVLVSYHIPAGTASQANVERVKSLSIQ